jgi:hypothetical protein
VVAPGLGWCFFVVTGVVDGGPVTGGSVVDGVVTVMAGGRVVGVEVAAVVGVVVVVVVVKMVTTGRGAVVPCVLSGAVLTATVPASTGSGLKGTLAGALVDGDGESFGAVVGVVVGGGAGSGTVVTLVVWWLDGRGVLPW